MRQFNRQQILFFKFDNTLIFQSVLFWNYVKNMIIDYCENKFKKHDYFHKNFRKTHIHIYKFMN